MAKIKLTKANIDSLQTGSKDIVYWDDALAGFGLKVTPKGRRCLLSSIAPVMEMCVSGNIL
jgi:hypothetical protein